MDSNKIEEFRSAVSAYTQVKQKQNQREIDLKISHPQVVTVPANPPNDKDTKMRSTMGSTILSNAMSPKDKSGFLTGRSGASNNRISPRMLR